MVFICVELPLWVSKVPFPSISPGRGAAGDSAELEAKSVCRASVPCGAGSSVASG